MRVLWTAKRSNQSILKEISPEYSLEGLMLKLKLQYFGHLMWRASLLAKTLMLGKNESSKWRRWQSLRWLDHISNSMDEFEQALGDSEGPGSLACSSAWGCKELDTIEWLNKDDDKMVIFSKNCFYWIMSFRETWNISKLYL